MTIHLKLYCSSQGVTEQSYPGLTLAAARQQAEREGYRVLSAYEEGSRRTAPFPLTLFATELLSLLKAGLNVIEAVDTLARRERSASREVLQQLQRQLSEGLSFSRALEVFPAHFPELFIAAMRASEHTGNLAEALERYLAYRQQLDSLKKKLIGVTIYPSLILGVGLLVVFFLLGYVVPKFSQVYSDMGNRLPTSTQWLMAWGNLVANHGWLVLSVVLGVLLLLVVGLRQPLTRRTFVQAIWRIPAIGERLRLYQLARFYRTLGMLQRGGIPFVTALGMVDRLLPQAALAQGLRRATQQISEGLPIALSMSSNGLTDDVAERLLQAGERSGNLGEMMERIANFYDDEMGKWLDWASRLFEPILMSIVGLVIGAVVMMMYMPIFELTSGWQ